MCGILGRVMAVDREFPALRRRLRWLQAEIGSIERGIEPGGGVASAGASTIYILEQYNDEMEEIDYILRWHQRVTNGALSRMQWMLVGSSLVISSALLILLALQRWLP